jgi:WW domain-binding protein 4
MSEYWVSKKKYFCKYCDIYIADDAPSRQQHENGMRHKGNQERFIRALYKTGEKRKKDQEEERREMQRIERVRKSTYL